MLVLALAQEFFFLWRLLAGEKDNVIEKKFVIFEFCWTFCCSRTRFSFNLHYYNYFCYGSGWCWTRQKSQCRETEYGVYQTYVVVRTPHRTSRRFHRHFPYLHDFSSQRMQTFSRIRVGPSRISLTVPTRRYRRSLMRVCVGGWWSCWGEGSSQVLLSNVTWSYPDCIDTY